MSADEYVPEEDDVRIAYLEAHVDMADPITRHQRAQAEREAEDAWAAFLARVRRDAAREALTRMVKDGKREGMRKFHLMTINAYRDQIYPEENPRD